MIRHRGFRASRVRASGRNAYRDPDNNGISLALREKIAWRLLEWDLNRETASDFFRDRQFWEMRRWARRNTQYHYGYLSGRG